VCVCVCGKGGGEKKSIQDFDFKVLRNEHFLKAENQVLGRVS
jgi:hypothetical protein